MGHFVVEVIGSEDEDEVSWRKGVQGVAPGGGVFLIVVWETLEGGIEAVFLSDESVEVLADFREFCAVGSGEDDLGEVTFLTKIKESEGDDTGSFVGGGFGSVD